MAWAINFAVVWVLIRLMQLAAPPPALEIFAFSGYSFVGYSAAIVAGWALGRSLGWYGAWLYTSMCMAIFLIRTFKQVIRIDAAPRGASRSRRGPSVSPKPRGEGGCVYSTRASHRVPASVLHQYWLRVAQVLALPPRRCLGRWGLGGRAGV